MRTHPPDVNFCASILIGHRLPITAKMWMETANSTRMKISMTTVFWMKMKIWMKTVSSISMKMSITIGCAGSKPGTDLLIAIFCPAPHLLPTCWSSPPRVRLHFSGTISAKCLKIRSPGSRILKGTAFTARPKPPERLPSGLCWPNSTGTHSMWDTIPDFRPFDLTRSSRVKPINTGLSMTNC